MKYSIEDIARIHEIKSLYQKKTTLADGRVITSEVFAVCPFCGDDRGKFSYVVHKDGKKNMYNCFHCGKHGNAYDLHQKLKTIDNKSLKGIGKTSFTPVVEVCDDELVYKASDEYISMVYSSLLKRLVLKQTHKNDLKRRGLTEEDIMRFGFKSTPFYKKRLEIVKELSVEYNLEGVPGFFKNKNGVYDISLTDGYLCPVYDGERSLITGFQIRLDNPINGNKYIWVSSAGKKEGCSSGALSTFLPGKNEKVLLITEGILKASVIHSLLKGEVSVLGIPGINQIKSAQTWLEKYAGQTFLFEAYDMDKVIKQKDKNLFLMAKAEAAKKGTTLYKCVEGDEKFKPVYKALRIKEAATKLLNVAKDYNISAHSLTWDFDKEGFWKDNFKGLDDFLNEYNNKDLFIKYLLRKSSQELEMFEYLKISR